MIVNFDAYNRFELPKLLLCNPGSRWRDDGTVSNAIGYIISTSDEEVVFNFNTTSELSFRTYMIDGDKTYPLIANRRLIYVDDIGFFVITSVDNRTSSDGVYKDVVASSCEVELENKKIPAIGEINLEAAMENDSYVENNTYSFQKLFEKVIGVCPLWEIGSIDSKLINVRRTFEDIDTDTNVLSFLLSDMQDAYECIFEFDITQRTVSAYSQDNYVKQTDIHLTTHDFISDLQVSENSEDIYTAITALGENELGIQLINPLGGNTIYNFDYYMSWMSEELRLKVDEWNKRVAEQLDPEYDGENIYKLRHGYDNDDGEHIEGYFELQQDVSDCSSEIDRLNNLLYYYNQLYINISTSSGEADIQEYNNMIEKYGGSTSNITPSISTPNEVADVKNIIIGYINDYTEQLSTAESHYQELNSVDGPLSVNKSKIDEIVSSLKLTEFFSSEQQDELSFYIYEGTYTDEYVAVTEDMPWYDPSGENADRITQIETLYERASQQLKKISSPKCEYSADVENFVFQKRFKHWGTQLDAGCLINVELSDGDVAALFLSSITLNYHDKSLSFTFGNRFDRLDPKALYEDVLGNVRRTANSINYVKDILYPIKSGELDAFKEALSVSRRLSKDAALNAEDQDIIVDDTGLLGRRKTGDGYDPHQIKLTNRNIVFTDDAWESCKTAIGEIVLPDNSGNTAYGINAQLLIGDLMMTSNLKIVDQNNNPVMWMDGDGLHAEFPGNITEENLGDAFMDLDKEGFSFSQDLDELKKYIKVGVLDDGNVGLKILHDGLGNSFYSEFVANELAFFSEDDGGASTKNTWMTGDALNIRRARIFNDILLGCSDDAQKTGSDYGKWIIESDEDEGLAIFWNG